MSLREDMSDTSTLSPGREASLLQSEATGEYEEEEEEPGLIPSSTASGTAVSLLDAPLDEGAAAAVPPLAPLRGVDSAEQ